MNVIYRARLRVAQRYIVGRLNGAMPQPTATLLRLTPTDVLDSVVRWAVFHGVIGVGLVMALGVMRACVCYMHADMAARNSAG